MFPVIVLLDLARIFYRATLPVQDHNNVVKCDVHAAPSSPNNDEQAFNGSPRRHSSLDEIFGMVNSLDLNNYRQRSLSDSSRGERNIRERAKAYGKYKYFIDTLKCLKYIGFFIIETISFYLYLHLHIDQNEL